MRTAAVCQRLHKTSLSLSIFPVSRPPSSHLLCLHGRSWLSAGPDEVTLSLSGFAVLVLSRLRVPVSASHCSLVLLLPLHCMRRPTDCGIGMNGAHAIAAAVQKDRCFALELMLLSLCSSATPFFFFSFLFFLVSFSHTHARCLLHLVGWSVLMAGCFSFPPHTHTLSSFLLDVCAPPAAACTGVPSAHTHTHIQTGMAGWRTHWHTNNSSW